MKQTELKPNQKYVKYIITIKKDSKVLIYYPGFFNFYDIKEDITCEPVYLTEYQWANDDICSIILQGHMRAALRDHVAMWEKGHEEEDKDENGEYDPKTWRWVPGFIDTNEFRMFTVPYHEKKWQHVVTDSDMNIIEVAQ